MENLVCDLQQPIAQRAAAPAAPAVPKAANALETTLLVVMWLVVGIPMLWGIFKTLQVVQYPFQ